MNYQRTTHVPNIIFDQYLKDLTHSELKILLYIIRQTYGWKTKNGRRKKRDRIAHSQFNKKTGVSRRMLPVAVQSLIVKHLIEVTNGSGQKLHQASRRKGKSDLYYAPLFETCAKNSIKQCEQKQKPVRTGAYNKTNYTKLRDLHSRKTNGRRLTDWERMQEILKR